MLKNDIIRFYEESDRYNEVKSYSVLKICVLYPATIMDESLLNILIGVITGLSMNVFTNYILFEDETFYELLLWFIRLLLSVVFNVCVIKISIMCTLLRRRVIENLDIPRKERITDYKNRLVDEYNSIYKKIKLDVIVGIVSFLLLCVVIVVYPLYEFMSMHEESIQAFFECIRTYFQNQKI